MRKDLLVNEPAQKEENLIVEDIEEKLKKLEKKKKSNMNKKELQEEISLIENSIRMARQLQLISTNLSIQYTERLKKASMNRLENEKSKLLKLDELPGMIEERRRKKKLKDNAEAITNEIMENPDCYSSQEQLKNNLGKESQHIDINQNYEHKNIEKG